MNRFAAAAFLLSAGLAQAQSNLASGRTNPPVTPNTTMNSTGGTRIDNSCNSSSGTGSTRPSGTGSSMSGSDNASGTSAACAQTSGSSVPRPATPSGGR